MGFFPRPKLPLPTTDQVAKVAEIIWYDGLRTGLVAGLVAGVVIGVLLTALLAKRN